MPQDNAKRGIHIKRLGLLRVRCASRRRIAYMTNAHLTLEISHIARAEYIAHKAITTMDMNTLSLRSGNARSILPSVLKQ